MELKETTHSSISAEVNVVHPSERNQSDDRKTYNMILSSEEDTENTTIDSKDAENNHKERKFGNVSTLDWLKTWRSIQTS